MKKTRKKRLLFVMPNLLGGGAQFVLLRLLKSLDRDKYEIRLFLFRNEGEEHYFALIPDNVTVETVFDRDAPRLRARYELSRVFMRLVKTAIRHDIIVGSLELRPTFLAYFAARLLGRRSVGWVHTAIEPYLKICNFNIFSSLTRFVYPRLDAVVFVSKGAHASMESFLGRKGVKNGMTIYNILGHQTLSGETGARDEGGKIVVAAGRLVSLKGFDILIKAHAKLVTKGVAHKLVILGEGPLRAELEALARDLGVSGSVVFEGYVVNPVDYFRKATVFVLSSRFEGLGMVILEAMAAGTPVVATDCPFGPAEILEDGKYGLLVPTEDADSLAGAMERMLSDLALQNHLRRIGPLRAADFSSDKIIPQWDRLFESL